MPGVDGARSVNVKVPIAFGATLISVVVATRLGLSHPIAIPASANAVESPVTARFT